MSITFPIIPLDVPLPVSENTTVSPPVVRSFPFASLARSVMVVVDPDTTVDDDTVTIDWDRDTAPGTTMIIGNAEVTAFPLIVANTVLGVPAVVPVNKALYVPLPLSVTLPIVPLEVPAPVNEKATVSPPVVRSFPFASLARSVMVVVVPDATIDGGTVTID